MCQICRLGQRQLKSRPPTSLLDTSQFSTLVVTDHRRNSTPGAFTAQLSVQGEPVPHHSTQSTSAPKEKHRQESGDSKP
ncbi:hypothetical protein [Acaryochloris marina]|uniref:hypothetical protein n=1 Tax=Acaryochloris marina TaxID=155978 RepID=UPI001BAFF5E0|nr:hypothetical protein [Acaryochloris marina]QUY45855.1 hypothetical protein I1H34_29390 [Acaryochloris marina S15]